MVTKPGLGFVMNRPAINPIPMKMIEHSVREVATEELTKYGINVIISVPKGRNLPKRLTIPDLAYLVAFPFWVLQVLCYHILLLLLLLFDESLDVSLAMGAGTVILSTGGRSEDFARETCGKLFPNHSFVQMGDFAGYALKQCSKKKVRKSNHSWVYR